MASAKSSTKAQSPAGVGGLLSVPRDLLSAGIELDAAGEIERQRRMEELKAELSRMVSAGDGTRAIDRMLSIVLELERENERLAWRVLRANRYRFGHRTEKLSKEELQQLFLALNGDPAASSAAEPPVPAPPEPEQTETGGLDPANEDSPVPPALAGKRKRKRVRSMKVGAKVERDTTVVNVPDEERTCAICGTGKEPFGFLDHETITFVPAKIVVKVERREKMSCPSCHKDVSVADRKSEPLDRKVDASVLAKLVADKCSMSMPLDRQRRELFQMGLDVPANTLQSYWAYILDLLEPVAEAVRSVVFASPIVGADDTVLKTLNKANRGGSFRGHLWCFVGTDGRVAGPEMVAYGYTKSWQATEITEWFSSIDGLIQCDGYAGYAREIEDDDGEPIVAVPSDRRLGCGMHIRSKFHAALTSKDQRAAVPLKYFADLYRIEAECKDRDLDAQARQRERTGRSGPILDALDAWVDAIHPKLLPKSPLRRATTYAIAQRQFFRRCFADGRLEIDNGRVERRIRNFTVGRRNFLFTGSVRGGERLAVAYTLVDNCHVLGIDPYGYLVDVIRKIQAGAPIRSLSALTPARWAADQA